MRVVAARADDKELTLTADISHGIRVKADNRLLKQIVLNLLSNAVKFTPKGASIIVRARAPRRAGSASPSSTTASASRGKRWRSSDGRSSRSKASSPRAIKAPVLASRSRARSPSCTAARCASARRWAGERSFCCGCRSGRPYRKSRWLRRPEIATKRLRSYALQWGQEDRSEGADASRRGLTQDPHEAPAAHLGLGFGDEGFKHSEIRHVRRTRAARSSNPARLFWRRTAR